MRRRFAGRQFHCGVCGARLDSLAKLQRHQASHPADSLRCAVCQESFSTAEELTRHGCGAAGRPEDDCDEVVDLVSDAEEPVPSQPAAAAAVARRRSSYMLSDSGERKEVSAAQTRPPTADKRAELGTGQSYPAFLPSILTCPYLRLNTSYIS